MIERTKVLFVSVSKPSFVKKDLELLKKHFDVKDENFVLDIRNLKDTLTTSFKIFIGVLWADVTYSWIAGTHAFWSVRLSKLFKKKSIVVVGGSEVAKVPEIEYGLLLNPKAFNEIKYIFNNADKVLTVDEGLKLDAIKNIGVNGINIQTVPTGYEYEIFKPDGKKENLVITVSLGNNWNRVRLKGLDTYVKSAALLQDMEFLLIGIQGDALKKLQIIASPNVKFIDSLSQDKLIPYYQKAKVYCQLSMREGLPNSLCEAMLCGCVPVGTDVQGVRIAMGNTGFYVPYGDPEATAKAIEKALKSKNGKEARDRIMLNFSMVKRENKIIKIIHNI